jgi:hypothetical protein
MLGPLFGFFLCMIATLTAAVVLLTSFSNISTPGKGREHHRQPAIGRTVMVETQRHLPVGREEARAKSVAKEASLAKDVSPVVVTAKANGKKIKHMPKVLARQRNNYGYGTALGYAEESRYGPRGPFFNNPAPARIAATLKQPKAQ